MSPCNRLPGCDSRVGVSGNDFLDFGNGNGNSSAHSQILGMGMKIAFPIFGNGNGNEKLHSRYLGTGMRIAFPKFGNGNETLVFPGMVGNGNGNDF